MEFLDAVTDLFKNNTIAFGIIAIVCVLLVGNRVRKIRRNRDADLDVEYQNMLREEHERERETEDVTS